MKDDNEGGAGLGYSIVLVMVAILASCSACGYGATINENGLQIGDPRTYAQATAVARAADLAREGTSVAMMYESTRQASSAQATATAAAVQMQATATAVAGQAIATATAQAQIADATATAVPYQAAQVRTDSDTATVRKWSVTLFVWVGGLLVAVLAGFAFVAWLRTRAKILHVGANGPVVLIGDTVIDTGRMIGATATVTGRDPLLEADRAKHFLKSGQVKPREDPQIALTDGGATADHYLEAARVAGQVNAMAAMFRPDNAQKGRKEKIELVERRRAQLPPARMPTIRVVTDPTEIARVEQLFLPDGRGDYD